MENDIDPPSILEDDEHKNYISRDNNILTGIPVFEAVSTKNAALNKSISKNKITINAIDKKKITYNNDNDNLNLRSNAKKENESINK